MQNFLPFSDFATSASVLDGKRLVKQFTETKQCLDVLCGFSEGWKNHPAVIAWRNNVQALINYGVAIGTECGKRGYKNRSAELNKYLVWCQANISAENKMPDWLGDSALHSSHRSRLLCKGELDVLCDAIKKHFKFKKIDEWCKQQFGLTKNQLKYHHVPLLQQITNTHKLTVKANHYLQFGWTDDPSKPYIWQK